MVALVLEGGGTKGSYHIGAYKALRELGIEVSVITGTSIGALNGAMLASGDYDAVHDLWYYITPEMLVDGDPDVVMELMKLNVKRENIGDISREFYRVIKGKGLDISPLKKLISDNVDEKKLRDSNVRFGLVTFSLTDLQPIEIFIDEMDEGMLDDYLLASAYLPVFKMERMKGKYYLDGGFHDALPVNLALRDKRIDKVIVVHSLSFGLKKDFDRTKAEIIDIIPSQHLGMTLDFSIERARENLQMGYYDALRAFRGYRGEKYYIEGFEKGFFYDKITRADEKSVKKLSALLDISSEKPHKKLLFEEIIPKIEVIYKLGESLDYDDMVIRLLEAFALRKEISRYRVISIEELMDEVGKVLSKGRPSNHDSIRKSISSILKKGNIYLDTEKERLLREILLLII